MKIEKMNEQQIRCTLTKEDLALRKIKLSELAYGSEKARSLFREMMMQASAEFDFQADDTPLMIEAVPMNSDCIVFTVTKVDDPEELDTRFAQFAPAVLDDTANNEEYEEDTASILDLDDFKEMFSKVEALANKELLSEEEAELQPIKLARLFSFETMDDVLRFAHIIKEDYSASNSLYKDNKKGKYLVLLSNDGLSIPAFNRICNIASEYGESEKNLLAKQAYLEEHCDIIIAGQAIQQLASI